MVPTIPGCVARDAGARDAIDGVQPRYVIEPDSADALAGLLAWASREHVSIVLRGGGTKLGWGRPPGRIDLVVSTARLNRLIEHAHGDLTATVEAGMPVAAFNGALGRHRQWLPVDSPFDAATVGGLIATNESGPLRQRHGTPRDLLIGIHLATTDGRLVKAGGNVVKNVAGYDLGRLMSGSFGGLAAIVGATFKLSPLPLASATVVAAFSDAAAVANAAAAIGASQLEPHAFDVYVGSAFRRTLLIQFASTQEAVDAQVDGLRRLIAAERFDIVTGAQEAASWRQQTRGVWDAPGAVIKVSWLPASLGALLGLVERIGGAGATATEFVGRASVGAGLLRVDGDVRSQVAAIERLRSDPGVGHVVVVRGELAVKQQADVWGVPADTVTVLRALKRTFDPAGILNAARGPI